MKKINFRNELRTKFETLTGCCICNIYNDCQLGNIPHKGLLRNRPLILNHYKNCVIMVLPYDDYCDLESGYTTVDQYIRYSIFNVGYYCSYKAYWKPVFETGEIKESLNQFKDFAAESEDQKVLEERMKIVVKNIFGFETDFLGFHESTTDSMLVYASSIDPGKVRIYIPYKIWVDLLYFPGRADIDDLVRKFKDNIEIAKFHKNKDDYFEQQVRQQFVHDEVIKPRRFCFDFWKSEFTGEEKRSWRKLCKN